MAVVIPVLVGAGAVMVISDKIYKKIKIVECKCCGKRSKNKDFDYFKFYGEKSLRFASEWIYSQPLCNECGKLVEEVYKIVLKKVEKVETYPIQYNGKKFEKRIKNKVPIKIDNHVYSCYSAETALKNLKINAVFHQSDTVIDIIYDHEGTSYVRYKAEGTAYVPEGTKAEWKGFSGPAQLKEFIRQNSDL